MSFDKGRYNAVEAPTMTGLTQPELIEFETEYAKYERKITEHNADRAEEDRVKVASIRDCMDAKVLHAMCIMGEIDGATSIEEATADKVKAWFDATIGKSSRGLSIRIKTAINSVKYKVVPDDPAGAALTFCVDVIRALEKQNASDVLQDTEKCEKVIDQLQDKIEPAHLRKKIRSERKYWSKAECGSMKFFKDQLAAQATLVQEFEDSLPAVKQGKKRGQDDRGEEKEKPKKKSKGDDGKPAEKKGSDRTAPTGWTKDCLNPSSKSS